MHLQFSCLLRIALHLVSGSLTLALLVPAATAQAGGTVRSLRGLTHEEDDILSHLSIEMIPDGIIDYTGTYDEYLRAQTLNQKARVA